jgi:hypothetical protein
MPADRPCRIVSCPLTAALVAASLAGIAALDRPADAGDLVIHYSAADGVLPTERCWDAVNPQNAPPPVIEAGALVFGTTGYGTSSFFQHTFPAMSFADGAAIEASVKVDSSTWYGTNPFKRTGFYLSLADASGKWAYLGIAGDRVLLQTGDQNWSDQTFRFNSTDGFHTYRLAFVGSTATVSIDGNVVLTDTVGSGAVPNRAIFGDISILGSSKTRTASVTVEGVPICSIADINCSGAVNGEDLTLLLGAWGTSLCEADLNEDGTVNGVDLATLLSLWG